MGSLWPLQFTVALQLNNLWATISRTNTTGTCQNLKPNELESITLTAFLVPGVCTLTTKHYWYNRTTTSITTHTSVDAANPGQYLFLRLHHWFSGVHWCLQASQLSFPEKTLKNTNIKTQKYSLLLSELSTNPIKKTLINPISAIANIANAANAISVMWAKNTETEPTSL